MKEDKYNEVGIPTGVLEHTQTANMVMTGNATAKPMENCKYPKCEECIHYVAHYCTVPIVVSKQIYRETMERIGKLEKSLDELENLVTEAIFGSCVKSYTLYDKPIKNPPEVKIETNLTWNDVLGENE